MKRWRVRPLAIAVWLCTACGDDGVAVTDASSSGSTSTGTTDEPIPTTGTPTSDPSTTTPTTDDSTSTTDTPTTTPVTVTDTDPSTGDTTTGTTGDTTTGTTDTTTDTTGDTDTTTDGPEVVGRSVSQTVNAGTVATSPNFRMVFTLGQPTSNQGTYQSANFRLQGGLIGANGNPP